ncbi:MAG: hypothetical protein ACYTG6_09160, partial [Planctomycetota bacterium]
MDERDCARRRLEFPLPGGVRLLLVLAFCLLPVAEVARAEEEPQPPREVAVEVTAEVDDADAADTGRFLLRLSFLPLEDIRRPYRVELRLTHRGMQVLNLDHSPETPTPRWTKGVVVAYELPVPLPLEADLPAGDPLEILLGFFDPEIERTVPPKTDAFIIGGRIRLAKLTVPDLGPVDAEERIQHILDRAAALAAEGRKADAWSALELGIRRAEEDATKYRFRDALLGLGHFAPRPQSLLEQQIVQKRIEDERRRHLRKMSGRYYDRGKLYAALRLLEIVGGSLSEESDAAVIGALAEAQRAQKDIQQIQVRLLARISEEDEEKARKAIAKHGSTPALLARAEAWFEEKAYARARFLFRELSLSSDRELAATARGRIEVLDAEWLAATPPDEQALVEEALNHPAFLRMGTQATHKFIYIGPQILVEGVRENSRLRFDVAFIFLTDLFGRVPNPGGDRVTVFWKELWDFGGGVGGGKTIDIGRADPEKRGTRVDTGLLYHELTHCVDDTNPILAGFREGLANFGAAYCFEALGQKSDELHAFQSNLAAFRKDYLERDLEYWRIQNYGPSAGFFLHFADAYARTADGHDWKPYRKFFREYRSAPVRDGREPYVARALAYYLVRAFGPDAFDDLLSFRFPLEESDRDAVGLEVEAFARGDHRLRVYEERLRAFPNSPLPRDLIARRMIGLLRGGGNHDEVRRISREELGVIHDWWVIGPFRSRGANPLAHVFPPEVELDLSKEYLSDNNMCKWRRAGDTGIVTLDPLGWVGLKFSYMDDTATYALTHVTVEEDMTAVAHVRADDDFELFVNDRLVEGYVNRGRNASDLFWWRGPYERAPDAMRFDIPLRQGRNQLLLKVKNRRGEAGFILALAREDGRPIEGLRTDLDPPPSASETEAPPSRIDWRTATKHNFRTRAFSSKFDTTVGEFKVVNRRLVGQSTEGRVLWRKYTVRPGFLKDSPSNLLWFREKYTEEIDAFRLTLDLVPRNEGVPKLVVMFMGEGETD